MDIYHSTYTQYIDLMRQLKGDVAELVNQSFDECQKTDGVSSIMEQIDNTTLQHQEPYWLKDTCCTSDAETMFPYAQYGSSLA